MVEQGQGCNWAGEDVQEDQWEEEQLLENLLSNCSLSKSYPCNVCVKLPGCCGTTGRRKDRI